MNAFSRRMVSGIMNVGPRFMPFADVATADVPLSRLLRLSLFQVSVGMALTLLVGTLNRVMIVELHVPAALVALMIALPVLYAPFRALVGFRSDTHRSELGWRRVPFIWMGTLIQFGGLATMPFALLVLSGGGNAATLPVWVGPMCAAVSFLMVGAGLHTTQTAGLALTTDLVAESSQPRVVGLMYVMLLLGSVLSGVVFGFLLQDFSPAKLVQVIQGSAVVTIVLNTIALWKQETRRPPRGAVQPERPSFGTAWASYIATPGAQRRLVAIGLGTMAFSMQDVLLEPYGGQVLGMSVAGTTWLTAALAAGGLTGFGLASRILGRGADPARLSMAGAFIGLPAFGAVLLASMTLSVPMFAFGAALIGLGAGIFSHGTLTVTMNRAPKDQIGLALGVWGAVQATCAGIAVALGGVLRDVVGALAANGVFGPALNVPATGYAFVYLVEITLLLATLVVMGTLVRPRAELPAMQAAGSLQR